MKGIFARIVLIIVSTFSLFFILSAQAATTYILDPQHSYVMWHISHFDFSNPSGKWFVQGTLVFDKDHPENSKVKATINVADFVTGIPELDKHLKGKSFFDVAKFPTATFVSNKVVVTGKNSAKVTGLLTIHGISKPVTLNVTLNKEGMSVISNKETVGFTASTILKRSDFGITTLLPGLGDAVKIDIEVEAYKADQWQHYAT